MRPDTLRARRAEGHILNLVPFVFYAWYDLWRITRSSSSGAFLAYAMSLFTCTYDYWVSVRCQLSIAGSHGHGRSGVPVDSTRVTMQF